MDPISTFNNQTHNVITALKEDLKSVRTGRANPSILENLVVEAYGGSTKLKLLEVATLLTEGPSMIVVSPFDPSTTNDVERAILKSPLGLSPQTQGTRILVRIPPLSQEQREKYLKLISQKVEEKKNNVRYHRDESRKKIKNRFELKQITEDDKFRQEKEIDQLTTQISDEIQTIKEKKEKEIMEV
ncbi:hypothetical protein A2966_01730 [Candidatus Roizmanbacteria bacterium RIFCSPLOWO2_01_FULL_41_22]|uniref:Ribosome recycling factor domain-containing protein n=2 Tax=Candidatus Roizmaniibacteriota TaxID=1752723 RepID=A0A1F7JQJ5_9BACT|nr:MAG: hypothetical protein A2966_01730 [Candidatus Roizmanbacteria bacterium RIFCSPLOWO2_01_FULL_41_22]OGK57875.1 MAG: hypothetical protein A3H86_03990 [Candidatus Roizmanbacteria bacterium RIFCSPLOWO2_02_FULL_41_9]